MYVYTLAVHLEVLTVPRESTSCPIGTSLGMDRATCTTGQCRESVAVNHVDM